MRYLDTASRLYRYPFADTLLIHAQRPDATACVVLEVWNEKMRRWVNRGAKGIALIDDTGPRRVLRYVFDVSDTHPVRGGRTPYLWRLKEDQREMLLNHLTDTYGLNGEDAPDLPSALRQVAEDIFNGDMFQDSSGTCSCSGFCTPFICWHVHERQEKKEKGKEVIILCEKRGSICMVY